MLKKISSVFVVYRCKTLTGSPDPTHANGTDKPCNDRNLAKISKRLRIKWNFELTVFELTVPDLY